MSITTTWTSLQALVTAELKRDDLTSYLPNFINQAEFRLSRDLRPRGFEQYAEANFQVNTNTVTIPERMLGIISFVVLVNGSRREIFRRSYSWLRDYWPDASQTDVPEFFSDIDGIRLIVAPTPDDDYDIELAYYEKLQPLDSGNETNWLTVYAPDLLLYATLLESAPFLRDDPRIAAWTDLYQRGVANLSAVEGAFKSDDATQASGG